MIILKFLGTKNLFLLAFTLIISLSATAQPKYDFVVAKDGSGHFKTVQQAINAVPDFRKKITTIYIKSGTYKEKLILPTSKTLVTLIGED
ncbi:MAG: pectinesterase family protein, partial [Bacteroidota bacterium]|nr:pectinesterase family protein [Bacteroidota bacterium]